MAVAKGRKRTLESISPVPMREIFSHSIFVAINVQMFTSRNICWLSGTMLAKTEEYQQAIATRYSSCPQRTCIKKNIKTYHCIYVLQVLEVLFWNFALHPWTSESLKLKVRGKKIWYSGCTEYIRCVKQCEGPAKVEISCNYYIICNDGI